MGCICLEESLRQFLEAVSPVAHGSPFNVHKREGQGIKKNLGDSGTPSTL